MKLLSLTVRNFMPYRGEQQVAFPQDDHQNVLVVFGENMRGKTSLLNAIRWCLYGQALDRDRRQIGLVDIINMDAASEGDWTFATHLRFVSGGVTYDLRRVAEKKAVVHAPRRDTDYDVTLSLTRDETPVRADTIEHEVNQIMPQQVSRFFLFDAELLAEYQELLAEESEQGRRIKDAVEQVLGVPALLNGKRELRTLLKRAQDALARDNRHSESQRALSDEYQRVQREIEALEADGAKLLDAEDHLKREVAHLDEALARTEGAQRLKGKIDALAAQEKRYREREGQLHDRRLEAVSRAWRDVLQPRLAAHMAGLERERDEYLAQIERRGSLKLRIAQLRTILESASCAVCEQPIAPDHRARFGASLGALESDLADVQSHSDRAAQISGEVQRLRRIGAGGVRPELEEIEAELDRIAVDRTRVATELEDAEDEIRGFDTAEIARQRAARDATMLRLGRLQQNLQRNQRESAEKESRKDALAKVMLRAPSQRAQRSAREVAIYAGLERLFEQATSALRERLRTAVERDATAAFKRLTTEPTYTGLKINESYGLSIIDREQRTVSVRSAGAEQIVALALIDGLNRTARKQGPVIIDTPLGRLDLTHRANVLDYLPTMASQLVLLVHEGEIDRQSGLTRLAHRIGGVYEIQRLSSSHSQIVRI